MITENEKRSLRYAGLLGHPYIVLDSKGRVSVESDTLEWAFEQAAECGGKVFEQYERRKFREVEKSCTSGQFAP